MKGLKQKISKDTSLQKISAEHGRYAKGFTSIWITENYTEVNGFDKTTEMPGLSNPKALEFL